MYLMVFIQNSILRLNIYFKAKTGFTIKPTSSPLNIRDILYGLAFKVLYVPQYVRHSSYPLLPVKPDVCYEMLSRIPLLANSIEADEKSFSKLEKVSSSRKKF